MSNHLPPRYGLAAELRERPLVQEVRGYLAGTYKLSEEAVERMLISGRDTMHEQLQRLERAVHSADQEAVSLAAHGLRGALSTLGLHDWAGIARIVEDKAHDISGVAGLHCLLVDSLAPLLEL